MVDAEPHTPCCSSFETYGGSSNVFEHPRLNHAVDPCVVDIQRHLNEPGQPDWPTLGELERRCRLGRWGSICDGHRHKWMGHNKWTACAWTTCVNGICDCALKWRSRTGHWSLDLHVQERAGRRNCCNRTLIWSTRELFALGRQPCAQRIQHRWWNTQFLLEA